MSEPQTSYTHALDADPQLDGELQDLAARHLRQDGLNHAAARREVRRRGTRLLWNKPGGCLLCGAAVSKGDIQVTDPSRAAPLERSGPLVIYGLCRRHLKDHLIPARSGAAQQEIQRHVTRSALSGAKPPSEAGP